MQLMETLVSEIDTNFPNPLAGPLVPRPEPRNVSRVLEDLLRKILGLTDADGNVDFAAIGEATQYLVYRISGFLLRDDITEAERGALMAAITGETGDFGIRDT